MFGEFHDGHIFAHVFEDVSYDQTYIGRFGAILPYPTDMDPPTRPQ